jgi:hypothetical protein
VALTYTVQVLEKGQVSRVVRAGEYVECLIRVHAERKTFIDLRTAVYPP